MRKWIVLIVLFAAVSFTADAHARRWFRRSSNTNTTRSYPQQTNTSDQQKCYNKASRMAAAGRMSHSFGPMAGAFEGVGWSSGPNPGTCTPRSRMTLTGDAIVRSSNGNYYRCRSWR